MGFLRRIVGGGSPPTRQVELRLIYFTRTRDDAVLQVVGEAYRQQNFAGVRPPGPGELPPALPPPPAGYYKAMLVPDPTNEHDRNAIAVHVWAGAQWSMCGYLSREDAATFQPVFRHLGRDGGQPAIATDAAIVDERGAMGVVLHLGSAAECMAELATDDRQPAAHPWVGKTIVFTGDSRAQLTGVPLDRAALLFLARWAGCEVLPRVTKKAQLLVAADPGTVTGNTQKAIDYSIPVVGEFDFLAAIGLPQEVIGRAQLWARG